MTLVTGAHDKVGVSAAGGLPRAAAPVAAAHGSSLSIAAALGVLLLIVALTVSAVLVTRRPWRHLRPAVGRPPRRPPRRRGRPGRGAHSQASGSAAGPALAAQIWARLGRPEAPSGRLSAPGHPGGPGPEHPSFPGAGYLRAVEPEQPGSRVADPSSSAGPGAAGPGRLPPRRRPGTGPSRR